jgi:hypothetical protein
MVGVEVGKIESNIYWVNKTTKLSIYLKLMGLVEKAWEK